MLQTGVLAGVAACASRIGSPCGRGTTGGSAGFVRRHDEQVVVPLRKEEKGKGIPVFVGRTRAKTSGQLSSGASGRP
jgi:hypothetical protein